MSHFSLCLRKKPLSKFKLFLFHHAGGNLGAYHSWFETFSDSIELTIVELPGRGRSFNRPLLEDYTQAVKFLTDEVSKQLDGRPFSIFGHSMGGLLSLGVSAELEKRGQKPHMVFVSGALSPKCQKEKPLRVFSSLPLQDLLPVLKEMGGIDERLVENKEILELCLPAIKADFKVCETFNPHSEVRLSSPLRVVGGNQDRGLGEMTNWKSSTSSDFKLKQFKGGHFYLNEERHSLCEYIEDELLKSVS